MKAIRVLFDPPVLIDGHAITNWPRDCERLPGSGAVTCTLAPDGFYELRRGDRVWRRHASRADGEFEAPARERYAGTAEEQLADELDHPRAFKGSEGKAAPKPKAKPKGVSKGKAKA